jgi:hypothetical protein
MQRHKLPLQSLNLAKEDTNTFDYLSVAKKVLAGQKKPAAGVITLFINDIEKNCTLCEEMAGIAESGMFTADGIRTLRKFCEKCRQTLNARSANFGIGRKLHRWFYKTSYVYRLMRQATAAMARTAGIRIGWGAEYDKWWTDKSSVPFRLVQYSIARIKTEFDRANVPMFVVLYPSVKNIAMENRWVGIYRDIAAALTETSGVNVRSGYTAFFTDDRTQKSMQRSLTDGHPNCVAHEIFAAWTFNQFREHWNKARPKVGKGQMNP